MKISNKILIVVIAVIGLYATFLIVSDINTNLTMRFQISNY